MDISATRMDPGPDIDAGRPDVVALAAAGGTIALHLAIKLTRDEPSVPFIAGACLFWTAFVVLRARQNKNVFRDWGFRTESLWPTTAACAAAFCAAATSMALIAARQGTLVFPLHTLALLLIYPIWGMIQQFLALGIVVGNLERIAILRRHPLVIIIGTALLFGLIHTYDWRLAAATFLFELFAIPLYLRFRSLWPIGILQGWLGALFYLWVLHEDLWVDTLGRR